jgi:hypothetical protein
MVFNEMPYRLSSLNKIVFPIAVIGILTTFGLRWIERKRRKTSSRRFNSMQFCLSNSQKCLRRLTIRNQPARSPASWRRLLPAVALYPGTSGRSPNDELEAWNHPSDQLKAAMAKFQREYMRVALNPETGPLLTPKLVELRVVDPPGIYPPAKASP